MENVLIISVFILGFVLILKGGDILVDSAVKLASKAKIPPMIVGATVVAIATTFPETTVSLISSFNGVQEVGINTAVGSMVCNFTIVLGISFLLMPTVVNLDGFAIKILYFCFCSILLLIFGLNGKLTIFEAVLLVVLLAGFIAINCIEASRSDSKKQDSVKVREGWVSIITNFVISALAIGLGAIVLVNNVDSISKMLGLNSGIISFVVIAVGTNIPELVTAISSVKICKPEIGIGNIFGASTIDCTLLIACSVFASRSPYISIARPLLLITVPALLFITSIIFFPIASRGRCSRWQGAVLLVTYCIYTFLIIAFS